MNVLAQRLKDYKNKKPLSKKGRIGLRAVEYCFPELWYMRPVLRTADYEAFFDELDEAAQKFFESIAAQNKKPKNIGVITGVQKVRLKYATPAYASKNAIESALGFIEKWHENSEMVPETGFNDVCFRSACLQERPAQWAQYYKENIQNYPLFLAAALRGNELPVAISESAMDCVSEYVDDTFTDKQICIIAKTCAYSPNWKELANELYSEDRMELLSLILMRQDSLGPLADMRTPMSRLVDVALSGLTGGRLNDVKCYNPAHVVASETAARKHKKASYNEIYGSDGSGEIPWKDYNRQGYFTGHSM